jgi:hypothetical protein
VIAPPRAGEGFGGRRRDQLVEQRALALTRRAARAPGAARARAPTRCPTRRSRPPRRDVDALVQHLDVTDRAVAAFGQAGEDSRCARARASRA